MARRNPTITPARRTWWDVVNSPLFITLVSLVLIAGVGKRYSDRQDALADQATRRTELGKLITEYQHRLSELSDADSRLDSQLGPSGTFDQAAVLDRSNARVAARWDRLTEQVSQLEWDVLTGRGHYVPTAPDYQGVSLTRIATQMEDVAGIPDIQFGGLRMIGLLEVRPPVTWLFVRAQLPVLIRFGVGRNLLYMNGTLPLLRGSFLTPAQERMLGIPQPRPGELEKLQRETDIHFRRTIQRLEGNGSSEGSRPARRN